MSIWSRLFPAPAPAVVAPAVVAPSMGAAILEYIGASNASARANTAVLRTGGDVVAAGLKAGLSLKKIAEEVVAQERRAGLLSLQIAKKGEEKALYDAYKAALDRLLYAAAFSLCAEAFPINKKGERAHPRYYAVLCCWAPRCEQAGLAPWQMPRGMWESAREEAASGSTKRAKEERAATAAPNFEEAQRILRSIFDEWEERYSPQERAALLEEMGAIADNA